MNWLSTGPYPNVQNLLQRIEEIMRGEATLTAIAKIHTAHPQSVGEILHNIGHLVIDFTFDPDAGRNVTNHIQSPVCTITCWHTTKGKVMALGQAIATFWREFDWKTLGLTDQCCSFHKVTPMAGVFFDSKTELWFTTVRLQVGLQTHSLITI